MARSLTTTLWVLWSLTMSFSPLFSKGETSNFPLTPPFLQVQCVETAELSGPLRGTQDTSGIHETISTLLRVIAFTDTSRIKIDSIIQVFTTDGRLTANFNGKPQTWIVTDYVALQKKNIAAQHVSSLSEQSLSQTTQAFGNIAHVYMEYELTMVAAGETIVRRGINSIQLLFVEGTWKIFSLTWDREREGLVLPKH